MRTKHKIFILSLPLVVGFIVGCNKSSPPPTSDAKQVLQPRSTAAGIANDGATSHIHWLGKKRIALETNSAEFISIWNLPESIRLENQTLDKLSTAPWRLLCGEAAISNAPTPLLRPLLDDVIQEESYIALRSLTNQPAEIVFAIRLDAARASLWQTNLAAVAESLTSTRSTPLPTNGRGWSIRKKLTPVEGAAVNQPSGPDLIEFLHVGGWTIVGVAQTTNVVLGELLARIDGGHTPFMGSSLTNYWLEADVDLSRITEGVSARWKFLQDLSRLTATVTGDEHGIRSDGKLISSHPLPLEMEAWNIPTNLIDASLIGITAVRGIRPWASALAVSGGFQLEPSPNQLYITSFYGLPAQVFFALPLDNASNQLHDFGVRLMEMLNPYLAESGNGEIIWRANSDGFRWDGMPFLIPFVQLIHTNDTEFVYGGTIDNLPVLVAPPPAELLQTILSRTNLLFYDWEITGSRNVPWLYTTQLLRLISGLEQLPPGSASIAWLMAAEPKLDKCTTVITKEDAATLAFFRISTVGFTSFELHMLADWLESPRFPLGLHSLSGSGATTNAATESGFQSP